MQRQKVNQQLHVWSSVLLISLIAGVVIRVFGVFVEQPYRDLIEVQKGIIIERVRLGHNGTVKSASFSPDGNKILTVLHNNTAEVWDISSNLLTE
jgi:WD40 repeat protein